MFGGVSKEKAEETFKDRVATDRYKTEYCNEKGIELLRIPYYSTEEEIATEIRSKAENPTPKSRIMI